MTRHALPAPPLPCYGIEYSKTDKRCQTCPHTAGCQEALGPGLNKIPVSKAVYTLLPPAFQVANSDAVDPAGASLEGFYQEAHLTVHGEWSKHSLHTSRQIVVAGASEIGTNPFMFMVAVIWSHRQTNPGCQFHPALFRHSDATSRAAAVKETCLRKFAAYDLRALDATLRSGLLNNNLRGRLLADEMLVGKFIVDRKIIAGGPSAPPMFRALELKLSPEWLAIEPSYPKFIAANPTDEPQVLAHRKVALLHHGALKRFKAAATSTFQARELIAPDAVRRVLGTWQLEPNRLLMTDKPVTDMLTLWTQIGLCLQHRECLRALHGQPNVYGVTLTQ